MHPVDPYTDQYKVKDIDLVSRSRSKVNSQDHGMGTKMYTHNHMHRVKAVAWPILLT